MLFVYSWLEESKTKDIGMRCITSATKKVLLVLYYSKKQMTSSNDDNKVKEQRFFNAIIVHTSDPAKGAMTRTVPRSCLRGNSSRRRIHPEVPLDMAKKQK